jgi:hypothetical protein
MTISTQNYSEGPGQYNDTTTKKKKKERTKSWRRKIKPFIHYIK